MWLYPKNPVDGRAIPRLMGVVNVTPDSFSDGGLFLDPERAVAHGRELLGDGADLLDVGGESTRPGAAAVGAKEELARVGPVIAALCAERDAEVVLMHMQGTPRTMQRNPVYDDVVDDVKAFLAERLEFATGAGIAEERIWLDPGIGLGKSVQHN